MSIKPTNRPLASSLACAADGKLFRDECARPVHSHGQSKPVLSEGLSDAHPRISTSDALNLHSVFCQLIQDRSVVRDGSLHC